LLQERATHTVTPDVLRPAFARELCGDVLDGVQVEALALNEANARDGGLPAFAIYFESEFFADDFEKFFEDSDGVSGIGTDHQSAFTLENFVAQRTSPENAHGVEDVVGTADAGHEAFGQFSRMFCIGIQFAGFAPRGNGGMLERGDAVAGAVERIFPSEIGGVKLIESAFLGTNPEALLPG
jgi:hypothetical protein